MKLVSVSEMRAIEFQANERGVTYAEMMQRAGKGVAQVVQRIFAGDDDVTAVALVGPGNNGGDALVALTELATGGWHVRAYLLKARPDDPLLESLTAVGGEWTTAEDDLNYQQLTAWLVDADLLLDGLLGTGVELPLRPNAARLLEAARSVDPLPFTVAIDCPSGVNCDTGEVASQTIPADVTVCMEAVKAGLLAFPAFNVIGGLEVVPLDLPVSLPAAEAVETHVVTGELVRRWMPERPLDAHKGSFGTATLVVGSVNYTGAAWLAGSAAYRVGAGLVQMAVAEPLHASLASQLPEAIWLLLPHEVGVISDSAVDLVCENLNRTTAMLLGSGWGTEDTTTRFLERLLAESASHTRRTGLGFVSEPAPEAKAGAGLPPLIIDADGLRMLARIKDWPQVLPAGSILTPHPGEMSALTGLPVDVIQKDRLRLARQYAREWKQVLVLKGALTVVADPEGRAAVIPVATPALARAGTGDVLAGIITGLRAQGLPPFEAAQAGAWIHAQAGLLARDRHGNSASVLARDVLNQIQVVMAELYLQ